MWLLAVSGLVFVGLLLALALQTITARSIAQVLYDVEHPDDGAG